MAFINKNFVNKEP